MQVLDAYFFTFFFGLSPFPFFFFFLAIKTFQITEYTPNFLSHTTWADSLILARTPSEINCKNISLWLTPTYAGPMLKGDLEVTIKVNHSF